MSLTLYMHPLASFCHKVLIALYENDTSFEKKIVDFSNEESSSGLLDRWPVGKIPVLHDAANFCTIPETSIIIEYLHLRYPGPVPLLPENGDKVLQVRLWDRFFDLYVSTPMQKIVGDQLRPEGSKDLKGVEDARATLDTAYEMIGKQMEGGGWATGDSFTMADCSAAPSLFFAAIVHPFGNQATNLRGYFDRLMARPSVTRVIEEARPFFPMFPFADKIPNRFISE